MTYREVPIDATSARDLASRGLRFDLLDTTDSTAFATWLQAVARGFHDGRLSEDELQDRLEKLADFRTTAVWDDTSADAATPVATVSSWVADLTVPGRRSVPSWAISNVTVAPTHRRRGIARNLLEAELRTAAELEIPVAILTVSEATIYGRYGFGPAAMAANWRFDTRRSRWAGPTPAGRVQLVHNESVRDGGGFDLVEKVRLQTPGQIYFDGLFWNRLFGPQTKDGGKDLRVARYDDERGAPQGFAIYGVKTDPYAHDDEVQLKYLVAATDDAYAALWRYLLEIDLVVAVTADLRPIDEPVQWQITDARAARKTNEGDHLWMRVLNVKAALEARAYGAAGRFILEISDPLGHAAGRYAVHVADNGAADVAPTEDEPDLELGVSELSAIYLGGVSAVTLARAGRIVERTPGAAVATDASFRSEVAPWLSTWF